MTTGVDRETRDMLREDMALHQQRRGIDVTDEANIRLLAPELERLDNQRRDEYVSPKGAEDVARDAEILGDHTAAAAARAQPTVERRDRHGREYLLSKQTDTPLLRKANEEEAWFLSHAMLRVELLMSLPERGLLGAPSWRERLMAVLATKNQAAAWKAASESPAELLASRHQIAKDQRLLRRMGLETISQLTPAFAAAKARELDEQYLNEFCLLLEDSNSAGFGDWKADPEKKTTVSG